jgi:hypothetical protein
MKMRIEEILTRLEEWSAQAVDISDPLLQDRVDTTQVCELIQRRGELIEQLQPVLAANAPVSYLEWNRIVVVHHQGSRIQENLGKVRIQLALELGANSNGRMFLERVTSLIAADQV